MPNFNLEKPISNGFNGGINIPSITSKPQPVSIGDLMNSIGSKLPSYATPDNAKLSSPILTSLDETLRYTDPDLGYNPFDYRLEYKYADEHKLSNLGNNLLQFGGRFLGAATEAIVTIPLAINALSKGDFSKLYDNELSNSITEWMDTFSTKLPVYTTEYEQNHPLLKYLNPFGGGGSFLNAWGGAINNLGYTAGAITGALIEDAAITALTGGTGLLPAVSAQLTQATSKAAKIAVAAPEEALQLARSTYRAADIAEHGAELIPSALKGEASTTSFVRGEGTSLYQGLDEDINSLLKQKNAREKILDRANTYYKIRDAAKYHLSLLTSASAEGTFEAAEVYKRGQEELTQEFIDKYGYRPSSIEDLTRIESIAKGSANFTMGANIALLYLSNRINWGSLFKPTTKAVEETITGFGKNVARTTVKSEMKAAEGEAAKTVYSVVSKTPETKIGKILLSGEKLGKIGLRSFNEGVEEGSQFTISEGSLDYAKQKYDPQNLKDISNFMKSFNVGLNRTFGTNEGWDNIIGGFIGGILGGGIVSGFNKITNKGAGSKIEQLQKQVDLLNKYNFNGVLENKFQEAVIQNGLGKEHKKAIESDDVYKAKNIKFDMLYNWVSSGIRANGYDKRMSELESALDLEGKGFTDMWGVADTSTNREAVRTFVQGIKQKAEAIKGNVEKVERLTKNPFKVGTGDWRAYESYKDELSLNLSRYGEYQRRINTVVDDLKKVNPLLRVEDAVNMTSIQGISSLMNKIQEASNKLSVQISQVEGNKDIQDSLFQKKNALDKLFSKLQPIVYSGVNQNNHIKNVDFKGDTYVSVLRDLHNLMDGIDIENNKYIDSQKLLSDGVIHLDAKEIDDDLLADNLQKLQDIYKLSDANYNIGKYYTYLRKGIGEKAFTDKIKQILEEAQNHLDEENNVLTTEDFEEQMRQETYADANIDPEETTSEERDILRTAAKKTVNNEDLTEEEQSIINKHEDVAAKYIKVEQEIKQRLSSNEVKEEDIEAPKTTSNIKYKGLTPEALFFSLHRNSFYEKLLNNLHKLIFNSDYKDFGTKFSAEIVTRPDGDKLYTQIYNTDLWRRDFDDVILIRNGSGVIGELRPPDSVYYRDNEGFYKSIYNSDGTFAISQDLYGRIFGNTNKTYDEFKQAAENYKKAYDSLKDEISINGKVDARTIAKYFMYSVNIGSAEFNNFKVTYNSNINKYEVKIGNEVLHTEANKQRAYNWIDKNRAELVKKDTLLKDVKINNKVVMKINPDFSVTFLKEYGEITEKDKKAIENLIDKEKDHYSEYTSSGNDIVFVAFPLNGIVGIQSLIRGRYNGDVVSDNYDEDLRIVTNPYVFSNYTIDFKPHQQQLSSNNEDQFYFDKNFDILEVKDYKEAEDNKYKPENQLKFNQGNHYESVYIIADKDLINLISQGSKEYATLKSADNYDKARNYRKLNNIDNLEKKLGITAYEAYEKAKKFAYENRDANVEKFIILGTTKKNIQPTYVKDKIDLTNLLTKNFNLTEEQALASAELFNQQAKEWLARNPGQALSDYYSSLGFGNLDAFNTKGLDKNNPDVLYQILGEKGVSNLENARDILDNLEVAKQMQSQGKDAQSIYRATGWELSDDNKWRYEIDDDSINRKHLEQAINYLREVYISYENSLGTENEQEEPMGAVMLSHLLKDSKLLEAYPEFNDIEVVLIGGSLLGNGSYNHDQKTITLNAFKDLDSVYSTLVHELQHAIQAQEGFPRGGNTDLSTFNNIKEWATKEIEKEETKPDGIRELTVTTNGVSSNKRVEYLQNLIDTINNIFNNPDNKKENRQKALSIYRSIAGEVEARNVQNRLTLSRVTRMLSTLKSTEDIDPQSKIYLYNTTIVNKSLNDDIEFTKRYFGLDAKYMDKIFIGFTSKLKMSSDKLISRINEVASQRGLDVVAYKSKLNNNVFLKRRQDDTIRYQNDSIDKAMDIASRTPIKGFVGAAIKASIQNNDREYFLEAMRSIVEEYNDLKARDTVVDIFGQTLIDTAQKLVNDSTLYQDAKGAFDTLNNVIYSLTNPDITTFPHELAHAWEQYLTDEERSTILEWANEKLYEYRNIASSTSWEDQNKEDFYIIDNNGKIITLPNHPRIFSSFKEAEEALNEYNNSPKAWTKEVSEKFAKGFEVFLAEGNKTKNEEVNSLFQKFAKWLADIYQQLKEALGIELNDAMRSIYSKMLNSEYISNDIKDIIPIDVSIELDSMDGIVYTAEILNHGTKVGAIKAYNDGSTLTINEANVSTPRQGIGIEAYRQLADAAYDFGLTLQSDSFERLSDEAKGLWEKLVANKEAIKGENNYIYGEQKETEPIQEDKPLTYSIHPVGEQYVIQDSNGGIDYGTFDNIEDANKELARLENRENVQPKVEVQQPINVEEDILKSPITRKDVVVSDDKEGGFDIIYNGIIIGNIIEDITDGSWHNGNVKLNNDSYLADTKQAAVNEIISSYNKQNGFESSKDKEQYYKIRVNNQDIIAKLVIGNDVNEKRKYIIEETPRGFTVRDENGTKVGKVYKTRKDAQDYIDTHTTYLDTFEDVYGNRYEKPRANYKRTEATKEEFESQAEIAKPTPLYKKGNKVKTSDGEVHIIKGYEYRQIPNSTKFDVFYYTNAGVFINEKTITKVAKKTNVEQYQTLKDEHLTYNLTLTRIAERFQSLFPQIKFETGYYDFNAPARFYKGLVQVNLNYADNKDINLNEAVAHEFMHPFIEALKISNIALYNNLIHDLRTSQQELIDEVNKNDAYDNKLDEALALYLGKELNKAFTENGSLDREYVESRTLLQQFINWLKDIVNFLTGKTKPKTLDAFIKSANADTSQQRLRVTDEINALPKEVKDLFTKSDNTIDRKIKRLLKERDNIEGMMDATHLYSTINSYLNEDENANVGSKFKFTKRDNNKYFVEFDQINDENIIVYIDPSLSDNASLGSLLLQYGNKIENDALQKEYNDIVNRNFYTNTFHGKTVKEAMEVKDLNPLMRLQDVSDFLVTRFDNTGFKIEYNTAERAAIENLEAYMSLHKDVARIARENIVKKLKALEDIATRRLNSETLKLNYNIINRLNLDAKDDVEFMIDYIQQASVSINGAWRKYNEIIQDLKNKEGGLSKSELNRLNKELAVVRQLVSFYEDFSTYTNLKIDFKDLEEVEAQIGFQKSMSFVSLINQGIKNVAVNLTVEWFTPYMEQHNKFIQAEGYTGDEYLLTPQKLRNHFNYGVGKDTNFITFWLGANITSRNPINAMFANTLADAVSFNNIDTTYDATTINIAFDDFLKRTSISNMSSDAQIKYYKDNYLRQAEILSRQYDKVTNDYKDVYIKKWALHQEFFFDKYEKDLASIRDKYKNPRNGEEIDLFNEKIRQWQVDNNFGKHDKYRNPAYQKLQSDQYFKVLEKHYNESNIRYGENGLRFGIIPQKYDKNVLERIKSVIGDVVTEKTIKDKYNQVKEALKEDFAGNLNNEDLENLDGTVFKTIQTQLTSIKDDNNISLNLHESIVDFVVESRHYSTLKETQYNAETLMLLLEGNERFNISKRKFSQEDIKRKLTSEQQVRKAKSRLRELDEARKNGVVIDEDYYNKLKETVDKGIQKENLWDKFLPLLKRSKTNYNNEMLISQINDVYFGENVERVNLGNLSANKLAHLLSLYTSVNNMAGNVTAAISNVNTGNLQLFIEAHGGKYFNKQELAKATLDYAANIVNYVKDVQSPIKSKDTQLSFMLDAIQGEIHDELGRKVTGNLARKFFNTNSLFFLTSAGEHQIQLTNMKAMLLGRKVETKSGEKMSLYDAFVADKDGRYSLRTDLKNFNADDLSKFIRDLHGVNRNLNGNYSDLNKTMLSRKWYGQLVLKFRKYLYPSFRTRWSSEHIDYERNTVEIGYLRYFFGSYMWNGVKGLLQGKNGFAKIKELSPHERYALRKAVAEIGFYAALTLLAIGLFGSGDDNKKRKLSSMEKSLLFFMLRLRSDIGTFSADLPSESVRQLKTPTASLNSVVAIFNTMQQLWHPFEVYEQTSGEHEAGDSKLAAKSSKLIPFRQMWTIFNGDFGKDIDNKLGYFNLINRDIEGVSPKQDR